MSKAYRSGGVGALMDEYERAAAELLRLVEGLTDVEFGEVRDRNTKDEHCRSIQTIVSHVIRSGYGYADSIRKEVSLVSNPPSIGLLSRAECLKELPRMLEFSVETLVGRWEYSDDQVMAVHIHSRWGVQYDMEQMLEHAIVHVLRHRRQIDRFLAMKNPLRSV